MRLSGAALRNARVTERRVITYDVDAFELQFMTFLAAEDDAIAIYSTSYNMKPVLLGCFLPRGTDWSRERWQEFSVDKKRGRRGGGGLLAE